MGNLDRRSLACSLGRSLARPPTKSSFNLIHTQTHTPHTHTHRNTYIHTYSSDELRMER